MLRSVFSLSPTDAFELMVTIEKQGKAVCGTYPRAVAEALLQAAQERIRDIGPSTGDDGPGRRRHGQRSLQAVRPFFRKIHSVWSVRRRWSATTVCWQRQRISAPSRKQSGSTLPARPLNGISPASLWIGWSQRRDSFPATCAPTFRLRSTNCSPISPSGSSAFRSATATRRSPSPRSRVLDRPRMPLRRRNTMMSMIGEAEPVKCLDNGLWLCSADDLRYTVLLSAHREHGEEAGVRIEIAAACRSGRRGVREALLRRDRGRGQRRELLPGQDPVVRRLARIIADGREALWSTSCRPLNAPT